MPTSGGGGQFQNLLYATDIPSSVIGSEKIRMLPYNFYSAGYIYGTTISNEDTFGNWWSSTALSIKGVYYLNVVDSAIYASNGGDIRYSGFSLRCITTPTS